MLDLMCATVFFSVAISLAVLALESGHACAKWFLGPLLKNLLVPYANY